MYLIFKPCNYKRSYYIDMKYIQIYLFVYAQWSLDQLLEINIYLFFIFYHIKLFDDCWVASIYLHNLSTPEH